MAKIRLILVDDHPIVRSGLRAALDALPDMEVVGEATDGESGVSMALELKPDVVVIDISMDTMNGLEATREIRRNAPAVKVLVLTMHENGEYLRQALKFGATGYAIKKASSIELAAAIRTVFRGEVFIYPTLTKVMLGELLNDEDDEEEGSSEGISRLSQRELQVLRLVAQGYTSLQIAEKLFLSNRTVDTYRARVMEKLHIDSRVALVRFALRHDLLSGRPTQ